jgi:hypothetical protein
MGGRERTPSKLAPESKVDIRAKYLRNKIHRETTIHIAYFHIFIDFFLILYSPSFKSMTSFRNGRVSYGIVASETTRSGESPIVGEGEGGVSAGRRPFFPSPGQHRLFLSSYFSSFLYNLYL